MTMVRAKGHFEILILASLDHLQEMSRSDKKHQPQNLELRHFVDDIWNQTELVVLRRRFYR